MRIIPDADFVKSNYDRTIEVVKTIDPGHPLLPFLDEMGERYALCPATTRKEYYSSFPGGLAFHNLHMWFWMKKFADTIAPGEFSDEAMISVSILHEIGKLGDFEHEYYLPKESDWHRKQGIYYEVNPDIQFMRIPDRSLYLAQRVYSREQRNLSQDQYLAILLHEVAEITGRREEGYHYKLPLLATVTQFAYRYSTQLEKQNQVNWPE